MQTSVSGASPLAEVARLDLRPMVHRLAEMPAELIAAAAQHLGKKDPLHLTGLEKVFYGRARWPVLLVGSLALVLGTFLAFGGQLAVGVPLALLGLVWAGVSVYYLRRAGQYAAMAPLRATALELANPGLRVEQRKRAEAGALREIAKLPRGDRHIWISDQLRLRGGTAASVDIELGIYCYEDRSTDKDGKTTYSTRTLPYCFLPLPRDIQARGGAWFRIAPKGFFRRRSEVSLSAAFDREYVIDTVDHDPDAALFVTRLVAPDVQELLLRYGKLDQLDLTFTGSGLLVRSTAFRSVLSENGHHDTREGQVFVQALFRAVHVVHEMFEQADPAYKLDSATKAPLLQRAGLAPSA